MIIDAQHHYRTNGNVTADLPSRIRWMDENGIDFAVLTTPRGGRNVVGDTWEAWNDELTQIERERPDRFVACPFIPLSDGKTAVAELERVVSKNGVKAVFIQPYKWRIDYDYLLPFYQKVQDLSMPIFLHPVHSELSIEEVYGVSGIGAAIGFPFNTTLAISRFMTSGILDTYSHLKIVLPHLGGALPFLFGRLEGIYDPQKFKATKPPSKYLDNFFFDVVCYTKEALDFASPVLGPNRLVYGTDFGCPDKHLVRPKLFQSFIDALPIGHAEKERILGGNLADLLKIGVSSNEERTVSAIPYQGN